MNVGAVVLTYKSWPVIEETLNHLLLQLPIGAIVVVDNEGSDTSFLNERFPLLRSVVSSRNEGYASGMVLGIQALMRLQPDLVLLLTHECQLTPYAIKALVEAFEHDDRLGLAGPLLGRSSTGDIWSGGGTITPVRGVPIHLHAQRQIDDLSGHAPYEVDWADGAALMVRLAALEDVGNLDPSFFLYNEEVDLALRMRRRGWLVKVVPQALAWQEPGMGGIPPYLEARNRLLLWRRNGRPTRQGMTIAHTLLLVMGDLRRRRIRLAALRLRGTLDALTGRLNRDRAAVRIESSHENRG